jgi:hypothetical protein
MDFSTILSSGVVAGLVAGLTTLRTTERKIAIENITQQRQLWRNNVREKCIEAVESFSKNDTPRILKLYIEFQLILNPQDVNDKSILDTLWDMQSKNADSEIVVELSEKLSLLLKHDWERAKLEAKPIWFCGGKPERISYGDFQHKRSKKS